MESETGGLGCGDGRNRDCRGNLAFQIYFLRYDFARTLRREAANCTAATATASIATTTPAPTASVVFLLLQL